jgi:hypothetical protein
MPSPTVELNSTSLGAWTPMVNGVNVAAGEVVSVRLADSAGVKLWQLSGPDDVPSDHASHDPRRYRDLHGACVARHRVGAHLPDADWRERSR